MKVLIDIPDDDYTSIRCEGLYCIGHDRLDVSVTTAFQNAVVYEENPNKWIPVSERLPLLRGSYKISEDVLLTNGYEIDMGYLVKRTGKIFWHYYGSDYEVGITDEDNDITAWMPLPEPYKGEREDEK